MVEWHCITEEGGVGHETLGMADTTVMVLPCPYKVGVWVGSLDRCALLVFHQAIK